MAAGPPDSGTVILSCQAGLFVACRATISHLPPIFPHTSVNRQSKCEAGSQSQFLESSPLNEPIAVHTNKCIPARVLFRLRLKFRINGTKRLHSLPNLRSVHAIVE